MSISEKKQELSEKRIGAKPEKAPPPPKEEEKDTSGFGGKSHITKQEFGRWLRKPERFKETGIPEAERIQLEKDFGSEYGYYIQKGEPEKVLKKLDSERNQAKTSKERVEKERKIRLLKKFLGK